MGGLHGVYLIINHGWRAVRHSWQEDTVSSSWWGRHLARTLTFLAVVVSWVFFRSTSFEAARRMLEGMCGVNGFAVPDYFAAAPTSLVLASVLESLGWVLPPLPILIGLLSTLLMIVWFAPNTQQIMGRYSHALSPYSLTTERPPAPALRWHPSVAMAVLVGALFSISVLGILTGVPSKFLYFEF